MFKAQTSKTMLSPLPSIPPLAKVRHNDFIIDCVHGTVDLDPLASFIVHTPDFQRLRLVKQLDCDEIFTGATHTRFSHCIGTYHITRVWLNFLRQFAVPNICTIDEWDTWQTCIEIAALTHDLGHIAFSHLLDHILVESYGCIPHEERSVALLKHLPDIDQWLTTQQLNLIGHIILGQHTQDACPPFVYQIVNNKFTDLDSDKIDYLLRDSLMTNKKVTFDWRDILFKSRIVEGEICFHESIHRSIYHLFFSRYNMFVEVYMSQPCLAYKLARKHAILTYLKHYHQSFLPLVKNLDTVIQVTDEWMTSQLFRCPKTRPLIQAIQDGTIPEVKHGNGTRESEVDITYRYTNQTQHPILLVKFYRGQGLETFHLTQEDLSFQLPPISEVFSFYQASIEEVDADVDS